MNLRKIVLVCHPSQANAAQTARQLADYLRGKHIETEILDDYRLLPQTKQPDFCVSLGGDGTTLRCARESAPLGLPVLAVNCGSLGFLSACEERAAQECLQEILDGNFQMTERLLLQADIERQGQKPLRGLLAFNDCLIKTAQPRAFTLRAERGGQEFKRFYGDGVIVSTPAGSTAYSLAAGGPVAEPDLNVFLLTPVCPHSLTERPLILHADSALSFTPEFKNETDRAAVSLDGQNAYELQNGDRVSLRRSEHAARLVCAGKFDFFARLRHKLEWGGRPC